MTVPPLADADLEALAGAPRLVLLLDVDGTLAPIAPTPEAARVPDATREALARLAGLPGVSVALVSGRAAADALRIVHVDGLWAIGNHGGECVAPDGSRTIDPSVAAYEGALAGAAAEIERAVAAVLGARVELKGLSASVHYRQVDRSAVPVVVAAATRAAERAGLRVRPGKEVVELRAPADVDKGSAAVALLDRLGARAADARVAFVGDDVTDEDAFRRLGEEVPVALTIRVGAPDVETAARRVVADPDAVRRLLERLAAARAAG